ncbi:MAG: BCD family MFS transporter [Anaerolineales bacterium]
MLIKRLQIGLIHVAVAMTLVPINSALNRVMIKELAISATLVAFLASLPYLFSPIQVAIGLFSDRHPLWGFRRTPYIVAGLVLCVLGVVISPQAAIAMSQNFWQGLLLGTLAFGAWGMGYNLATVSYFSLATEISGEGGRGRTIAIMFFMMIAGIIATAITLSRLLEPYSLEILTRAFWVVAGSALLLGTLGLVRLESRAPQGTAPASQEYAWGTLAAVVWQNRQARLFFFYLVILLAALLGQDVLLEPFAAEAFEMTVRETTRITSVWGTCVLAALLLAGFLETRLTKRRVAQVGGAVAMAGFMLITVSGIILQQGVFYAGVVLLGIGTGLSTVANLSLMLDMTTPENVGLYIGAWGMANAFSRLTGSVVSAALRDVVTAVSAQPLWGYVAVFTTLTLFLLVSLLLLRRVDVGHFRRRAADLTVMERAALSAD